MTAYYCTVRGTIQTASLQEIFQHSIVVDSPTDQATTAAGVESTFRAAFGGVGTKLAGAISNGVVYTEVTAAKINDLFGVTKPVLQAASHVIMSPTLTGAATGNMLPAQNTVTVSLTAGLKPNGANYKGRFYLPTPPISAVAADGKLVASLRTQLTNWAKEWLDALKFVGCVPQVWSRHNGVISPVVTVRVGDRVDTIRSRRNKGVEAYATQTLA